MWKQAKWPATASFPPQKPSGVLRTRWGIANTDLARQLQAETLGARLWRLHPGQASTRHRHRETVELRQPFNDTDADQLWLVVGAPPEPANSTEMTEETMAWIYPDGPEALPSELAPE